MPYYMRGDFYPPGYSVGDPFFGFLGPLISKGIGLVKGVLGPAGAKSSIIKTATEAGGRMISKHPVLSAAGAAGAIGAAGMGASRVMAGGHRKCKHINPHTGKCRRRMRVTNTKALRRALRRAYGFERIAMKTIHLLHPKKKGRFGGFKKRRRAA